MRVADFGQPCRNAHCRDNRHPGKSNALCRRSSSGRSDRPQYPPAFPMGRPQVADCSSTPRAPNWVFNAGVSSSSAKVADLLMFSICNPSGKEIDSILRPSAIAWHRPITKAIEYPLSMLANVRIGPKIKDKLRGLTVTRRNKGFTWAVKGDVLLEAKQNDGRYLYGFIRSECRDAAAWRSRCGHPVPVRHRHPLRRSRIGLLVFDG